MNSEQRDYFFAVLENELRSGTPRLDALVKATVDVAEVYEMGTPRVTVREADERPQWHAQPPRRGLYLYANKPKDWDISEPVGVCSVDYCDGKGAFLTANYRRERVLVAEMPGIWWGPLATPTHADKPAPELLKE